MTYNRIKLRLFEFQAKIFFVEISSCELLFSFNKNILILASLRGFNAFLLKDLFIVPS
jgi:hypothetical protein